MKTCCEIAATTVLPAIRSIITKELTDTYNLTQEETAELLGLTQPAVSQYKKEARGVKVRLIEKNQDIMKLIDELTSDIINENIDKKIIAKHLCHICRQIIETGILIKSNESNECPLTA
jgi:predicted transcriptional regulator